VTDTGANAGALPTRRPTGEIPLSWALPAEAVSDDVMPQRESPAASKAIAALVLLGFAVVVFVVVLARTGNTVGAAGVGDERQPTSAPIVAPVPPTAPALTETRDVVPPTPVPAFAGSSSSSPTPPPVATPAPAPTPARDTALAQKLLNRAKLAARDGDDVKGRALAEQAVEADANCESCWRTLAFMRGRAGDRAGAALARGRADALKKLPAEPLVQ